MKTSLVALSGLLASLSILPTLAGCSGATDEDGGRAPVDRCEEEATQCQAYGSKNPNSDGTELGKGDGSPSSVKFTTIFQGPEGHQPVDLEFNPTRSRELWVLNYASSSVTIITNPGLESQSAKMIRDPAYAHFMNRPPGLAFGVASESGYGQEWATCGDNDNGGNYFMGPTLYSASEDLFGIQTEGGLGSHLDMLHSTPYCRGIAWAGVKNTFYTFNAFTKSIEYYDFRDNHAPGEDDHSDGQIRRYWNGKVSGLDGAMSHLSFDRSTQKLYVADTGNQRIAVLDPSKAQKVAPMPGVNEPTISRDYWETPLVELVPPGTLEAPSGIEATGGLVFVTDALTSTFYAFKAKTGELVRKLETGLPKASLAGFNFGPDGKIYFVDRVKNRVVRIDP